MRHLKTFIYEDIEDESSEKQKSKEIKKAIKAEIKSYDEEILAKIKEKVSGIEITDDLKLENNVKEFINDVYKQVSKDLNIPVDEIFDSLGGYYNIIKLIY